MFIDVRMAAPFCPSLTWPGQLGGSLDVNYNQMRSGVAQVRDVVLSFHDSVRRSGFAQVRDGHFISYSQRLALSCARC